MRVSNSNKENENIPQFFSDPGFQNNIAKEEGVHYSTVNKTTDFVMGKILEKSNLWETFPVNKLYQEHEA